MNKTDNFLEFETLADFTLEWIVYDIEYGKIKLYEIGGNRIIMKKNCDVVVDHTKERIKNYLQECLWRITRLSIDGGHAVFELEDGTHHDHLLCVSCNQIEEFVDEVIEQRQRAIAEQKGFEMTEHSLYIYGICKRCQAEKLKG